MQLVRREDDATRYLAVFVPIRATEPEPRLNASLGHSPSDWKYISCSSCVTEDWCETR